MPSVGAANCIELGCIFVGDSLPVDVFTNQTVDGREAAQRARVENKTEGEVVVVFSQVEP